MALTRIEQIRAYETAAGKILAELGDAEKLTGTAREQRERDCCARLVPIYEALHHLTKTVD